MKHQLVFQLRGDSLADYGAMIALEEELIAELAGVATVDGHEVGSGETNIFVLTDDPRGAFLKSKPILESRRCLEKVVAAYRSRKGEVYTVVWPEGFKENFGIR